MHIRSELLLRLIPLFILGLEHGSNLIFLRLWTGRHRRNAVSIALFRLRLLDQLSIRAKVLLSPSSIRQSTGGHLAADVALGGTTSWLRRRQALRNDRRRTRDYGCIIVVSFTAMLAIIANYKSATTGFLHLLRTFIGILVEDSQIEV